MADEDEEDVLVTMRVQDAIAFVPGSRRDTCDECHESVWVSPSSLERMGYGHFPDELLCTRCAVEGEA